MKSLILIIIFSIILTNCGFKPIYNSKNSSFQIIEINNKNQNKNSFSIENLILSLSNKDAQRKIKLEIDYKQSFATILKDNKGDPSKKKLSINVNLIVKNEKDNTLTSKSFNEEFNYDVQSDKFNMSQYEDNIINNLNNKISNDIILLLGTILDMHIMHLIFIKLAAKASPRPWFPVDNATTPAFFCAGLRFDIALIAPLILKLPVIC